jgi:hypothetical protein
MSGLREALENTVSRIGRDDVPVDVQAAEYFATFRQWLADQGLVCVPREATEWMKTVGADYFRIARWMSRKQALRTSTLP